VPDHRAAKHIFDGNHAARTSWRRPKEALLVDALRWRGSPQSRDLTITLVVGGKSPQEIAENSVFVHFLQMEILIITIIIISDLSSIVCCILHLLCCLHVEKEEQSRLVYKQRIKYLCSCVSLMLSNLQSHTWRNLFECLLIWNLCVEMHRNATE